MKTRFKLTKYSLIALLIAFAALGGYTALLTYQYQPIVKGILGFVAMYLIFRYIAFLKLDGSIEELLLRHNIYKNFVFAFIGAFISYWAMMQIYEMIMFFF